MSSGQKSVCGSWGGERFALLGFAAERLCPPLENLLKACHHLFTTVFAQSTLTNAIHTYIHTYIHFFNPSSRMTYIQDAKAVSDEREKGAKK